jgi:NAD(P)-dependent dehydrogenase (short-subunit alcohol dehydrogenase family)
MHEAWNLVLRSVVMEIRGSVALITGASRGIGKATALMLGQGGANLALNSRKSKVEIENVAEQIRSEGSKASVFMGDVTSFEDCGRIVRSTINTYGSIDILVNNAGIFELKPLSEMDPEDWESMFKVHVFGAFNMIRHTLHYMIKQRKGVIVNVSSFVALRPSGIGRTHYASAKAALIGLTRSLALEVAKDGVRVVGIAPGLTDTEMVIKGIPNLQQRLSSIPIGRIGKPEEIAQTIKCLIESDFTTGETVVVSGGE